MDLRRSILNRTDNSFRLARHLFSKDSNLIFSPLSIHVSLGMTAAGSNAPTQDQIAGIVTSSSSVELTAFFSQIVSHVLADGGQDGWPVASAANGLWVDLGLNLKPAFQDLLHRVYKAAAQHVDFRNKAEEVTKQVNEWCDKATKGLIKDMIPPGAINPLLTRLILANAVYFKGTWSQQFDANLTREGDFHLMNGSSVRAPMMTDYIFVHQYFRAFDGFKVLKLPYKSGRDSTSIFSMYIYLPDSKDGLPSLRERVCSKSGFINSHLLYNKEQLDKFCVPKFKISFGFEASDLLKKLGLVLPFQGDALTEMVESCPFPLQVTGMFHKAFVTVNEEGTEAAAASGVLCGGGGPPPSGKEFVADHPFMFVIREDTTGLVLFIGQILNPLA